MTRHSHDHEGDTVRGGPRAVRWSLALFGLLACGPDTDGKFNEYVSEAKESQSEPMSTSGMEETGAPTTTAGETGGTGGSETGAPPPIDLTGTSLLAISTIVQPDLPLQFLSTVTQRTEGDAVFIDITLQPLSLEVGSVTMPRQPVGDPLTFKDVPVVDGKYTVDAGETMVTGMANPITGSDITATLVLSAEVKDADFVCGEVTGMVTAPLMTTVDGSTFAAVRLEDPNVLPTDVTINCAGETRTDA